MSLESKLKWAVMPLVLTGGLLLGCEKPEPPKPKQPATQEAQKPKVEPAKETGFTISLDTPKNADFVKTLATEPYVSKSTNENGEEREEKGTKRTITPDSVQMALYKIWESGFLKKIPELRKEIEDNKYDILVLKDCRGLYLVAKEKVSFNVKDFSDVKYPNRGYLFDFTHTGIFGEHEHLLECRLQSTAVHELFHDVWFQMLNDKERQEFSSSMFSLYGKIDNAKEGIGKIIEEIANSMNDAALIKLREANPSSHINYKKLFFDYEERCQTAGTLHNRAEEAKALSEKPEFKEVASLLKKESEDLYDAGYYFNALMSGKSAFRTRILEEILKKKPETLGGISTPEEFRYLEHLLGSVMQNYLKNFYKDESVSSKENFCSVEGFAFLAQYVFDTRQSDLLPKSVLPLYERFIDFGSKAFTDIDFFKFKDDGKKDK